VPEKTLMKCSGFVRARVCARLTVTARPSMLNYSARQYATTRTSSFPQALVVTAAALSIDAL
jgi:hypothetical protein